MKKTLIGVAIVATLSLLVPAASAGPDECRDAIDKYKSALDDISFAATVRKLCGG